jgi:DNA (cytosine-5)-methyltransferase 1
MSTNFILTDGQPSNHDSQLAFDFSSVPEAAEKTAGAVQLAPTPVTPRPHDSENTAGKFLKGQKQKCLEIAVARNGGQLNPTWVEWLMGFPLGWTDLKASVTPLSLNV